MNDLKENSAPASRGAYPCMQISRRTTNPVDKACRYGYSPQLNEYDKKERISQ